MLYDSHGNPISSEKVGRDEDIHAKYIKDHGYDAWVQALADSWLVHLTAPAWAANEIDAYIKDEKLTLKPGAYGLLELIAHIKNQRVVSGNGHKPGKEGGPIELQTGQQENDAH